MTEPQPFHFAIKSGEEPVQLRDSTAHTKVPWVARGYQCFDFYVGRFGVLRVFDRDYERFNQDLSSEFYDKILDYVIKITKER